MTPVELKKNKEISSDSLQNPSDPDATYSGHKGQGFQIQVIETFCDDEQEKEQFLNLITHDLTWLFISNQRKKGKHCYLFFTIITGRYQLITFYDTIKYATLL